MVFVREGRKGNVLEMLEFSCPYGYISHERNSMKKAYEGKIDKYTPLAEDIAARDIKVKIRAIIVSSMGAVHPKSLQALQEVLKCNKTELRKLGERMSEEAIRGSMDIWRETMKGRAAEGTVENVEAEVMEMERLVAEEPNEEGRENDDDDEVDEVDAREEFDGIEEEEEEGVECEAGGTGMEGMEELERMARELKELYPVRTGRTNEEEDEGFIMKQMTNRI
jgi:hypothetical protein